MEYSFISRDLTTRLSKIVKKNNGIYFTPPSCINNNLELLRPYINDREINVLEPSCGSGEYITALHRTFPRLHITGIESNDMIYESILELKNDKTEIIRMDYLKYETNDRYDLIIGNPPFYVMKKESVDKCYHCYFEGRPNIFVLFIIKSLELLKENGILSFILPKNFLNCLYYDKTRKYIDQHFQILNIAECKDDKYIETQQDTIILIIRKTTPKTPNKRTRNNSAFILKLHNYTIFMNEHDISKIMDLYKDSKSLLELGFKVSVGNVVWNQCKDILTDDTSKTRLIYSSDIENNTLIRKRYNNSDKKNFINKPGITRPMIVINRGYGIGEYKFHYCLIDETNEYLIENHLICIECKTDLPRDILILSYKKILLSLNDKRTTDFISIYFGNNAINTTELNNILPIYQDIYQDI